MTEAPVVTSTTWQSPRLVPAEMEPETDAQNEPIVTLKAFRALIAELVASPVSGALSESVSVIGNRQR